MRVKIVRVGLRPVRDGMILWESDRLREIDRSIYAIKCRVTDLELEIRGKFYEFNQDFNREIPDHILIDRLRSFMGWSDQQLFDRHIDRDYYGDRYGNNNSDYYDDYTATNPGVIRQAISDGISDAFSGIGKRINAFVKEQENAAPTPTPAPPTAPPAAPAATQQDVAALQQQLAALQAQLAALQAPVAPPPADGGTK